MKLQLSLLLLAGVSLASAAPIAPLEGKKVLYVIQMAGPSRPTDDKIKAHMEALGFEVALADQADSAAKAGGNDLVVISSSVSAHVVEGAYRDVPVPVLTWESNIYDDMRMTGKREDHDFGTIPKEHYVAITNASHPIAAGLPSANFGATSAETPMNWGKPGLGASIIATQPGYPEKALVFAYEKGATMDYDFLAPARRVGFFLDNDSFQKITPAGLYVFDAALRWAVGHPAPTAQEVRGKKALLVGFFKDDNPKTMAAVKANDGAMKDRLEALGFTVSTADQSEPATRAEGQDLVVISASIQANKFLGKYRDVGVPVLTSENDILDDMDMSGQRRGVDFGDAEKQRHLWLVNAPHPLSGGLPAGTVNVYKDQAAMGWATPGIGAVMIATLPGQPKHATIYGYEKGATMDGHIVAPARRTFFFIDYNTFTNLSDQGLALFDAAVRWTAAARAPE